MTGDWIGGVALVLLGAGLVVGLVRAIGWFVAWTSEENPRKVLGEAFELAHDLFGHAPWVQIIVSRTADGYIATAHNQGRTQAVSGRRHGPTAESALRLLCRSLHASLERQAGKQPVYGRSYH
jgi:hypothetical protein